nr:unnamed protein product [Callosobruchus analis]
MSSTLIAALPEDDHAAVNSTGSQLLLEFYAEAEDVAETQACGGGFFAVATQFKNPRQNISTASVAQSVGVVPAIVLKLTAVHIAAIFFLSGLIIATIALAAQYVIRYRKYHVAKAEDQDSLAGSNASVPIVNRASSSATLLSEVISLTRLRPHIKPSRAKHTRLRESVEYEPGKNETEVTLAKEEEFPSDGSTATLTQAETATLPRPVEAEPPVSTASLPCSPQITVQKPIMRRSSTLTSEKDKTSEKEEVPAPPKEKVPTLRRFSNVSNATLTNGCYTSAASIVSRATIKSTNAKETKEKKNREKLMAGPGSDFSITGQDTDLEMDYYDYNVINAGAAPGSYLGMDPAFLVWIPPLDESGEILPEEGQEYHEMQDIRPKLYIDPGSNKESPEQEMLLPKSESNSKIKVAPSENRYGVDNRLISEVEPLVHKSRDGTIQEFHRKQKISRKDSEKETKVEKSPSLEGSEYLDDIRYADDEDDDQCNNDVSYQDSNILSSS